ncbi:MAG: YebC/PmpR family DNA-binding transcriptional regulator [Acidobacteria bacterium CG_4_9_14_3_um_filter_49_7]|nr:MAG: YebC/PmpR family DNA-binding transcriptional regulator [Acidobacteria bacterium CG_4_9_14_3_um_filter_49_7]
MSGHSKWANIKHKKGREDVKRGKIFTRLIKEITIAARLGGGDESANPRLRSAIATGKAANMPADNIKRAIMKGTGELEGVSYEEATYEGYGPGGVAVIVECLTDNRNRTTPEIRHLFGKYNGNLGENGSVSWMFNRKGNITIEKEKIDEEALFEIVVDNGGEDVLDEGETWGVYSEVEEFENVREALENAGVEMREACLSMIPTTTTQVEGKKLQSMLKLLDAFEDHEDVQNVWSNMDFDEAELED